MTATLLAQFLGWNKIGVLVNQWSLSFNMIITPMFWIAIWPLIWPYIKSEPLKYSQLIWSMSSVHLFPMVNSLVTVYTSDFKMIKEQYPQMFILMCIHIPFNYYGTSVNNALYPYPFDWKNFEVSLVAWVVGAAVMAGMYYVFANHTSRASVRK